MVVLLSLKAHPCVRVIPLIKLLFQLPSGPTWESTNSFAISCSCCSQVIKMPVPARLNRKSAASRKGASLKESLQGEEKYLNKDFLRFPMKARFFKSPEEFRAWLELNHSGSTELLVGFYKKGSGKPSITWPESVDQALCFGWIDGIRRNLDEESYTIRFTPRKARSTWSTVNIGRAEELIKQGLMTPAGMAAYRARIENRSGIYSYEQRSVDLPEQYAKKFKSNRGAWEHYQSTPGSYRKAVNWWVLSAKREETRIKRLERLIEDSERGQTIPQFTRAKKRD